APLSVDEQIPEDETGTTITFWPSTDIFDTVVFDFETLRARLQQMAFLNKGLAITLTDERPVEVDEDPEAVAEAEDEAARAEKDRSVTYRYADGILDYVKHINRSKRAEPIHDEVIAFELEDTERALSLEVAMQWTAAYS